VLLPFLAHPTPAVLITARLSYVRDGL